MNAITYKEVFPLIKENKLWLGATNFNRGMYFRVSDDFVYASTNFVDVVPQKKRLRLSLNMAFNELIDPRGWCGDVTNKGRWGNGDVEVFLESKEQLEYVMSLINQAYDYVD